MRSILSLLLFIAFGQVKAQQNFPKIAADTGKMIIEQRKLTFPKFYKEYQYLIKNDTLIKSVVFIDQPGVGPAFAAPNGTITFNLNYLTKPKPVFDDNRLIVVFYHEVGHLHYFMQTPKEKRNPEDSEKAAFEYSLLKTKEMAVKGDCLPLKTGVKFMKMRSEQDDLKDPHVRALKRMVVEPLYAGYVKYVEGCR